MTYTAWVLLCPHLRLGPEVLGPVQDYSLGLLEDLLIIQLLLTELRHLRPAVTLHWLLLQNRSRIIENHGSTNSSLHSSQCSVHCFKVNKGKHIFFYVSLNPATLLSSMKAHSRMKALQLTTGQVSSMFHTCSSTPELCRNSKRGEQ